MALIFLPLCGAPTETIQPGRFASVCVGNCGIGYWNLKISVMTKENMLIELEDRLELMLWRVEGWIDRSPRLSRWYTDWLLPRVTK